MKAKLAFALTAFALTLTLTGPEPRVEQGVTSLQCASFCMRALCPDGQKCGLHTNSSGETVCGCY